MLLNCTNWRFCCTAFRKIVVTAKLLSHTAQFKRVDEVLERWKDKFIKMNIPEPLSSIEHILAYTLGSKNVSNY